MSQRILIVANAVITNPEDLPADIHHHERDVAQRIRDRHGLPTTTLLVDADGRLVA